MNAGAAPCDVFVSAVCAGSVAQRPARVGDDRQVLRHELQYPPYLYPPPVDDGLQVPPETTPCSAG